MGRKVLGMVRACALGVWRNQAPKVSRAAPAPVAATSARRGSFLSEIMFEAE